MSDADAEAEAFRRGQGWHLAEKESQVRCLSESESPERFFAMDDFQ